MKRTWCSECKKHSVYPVEGVDVQVGICDTCESVMDIVAQKRESDNYGKQ